MKKLILKIKMTYYSIVIFFEELLEKLRGKESNVDFSSGEVITQNRQNEKLSRGIRRLVKSIYGKDGKLSAAGRRSDVLNNITGHKTSTLEKMEVAKLRQKQLNNPTLGTVEAQVQSNVKNAPRYVLERERRDLHKALRKAITIDNIELVKEINGKIKDMTFEINRMKL